MLSILILLTSSLLGAWSGGSLWPSQYLKGFWTNVPEIALSAMCGIIWGASISWWGFPFVVAWCYAWIQTGHANALNWGHNADPNRKNTLTPIVEFIYRGGFGRKYSAVFFSVKGFLLSLPFSGLGAIYWPMAYDIGAWLEYRAGWKHENAHRISELASGFFFGCNVLLVYKLMS